MNRLVILHLFMLISCAVSDVVVTESGKTLSVGKDAAFTLKCTVTSPDTFDKWSNPLHQSSINDDPDVKYLPSNGGDDYNLEVSKMKVSLAGVWTCSSKEGKNDSITLEFTVAVITPAKAQQILIKDMPGAIFIDIRGYPAPVFTWQKDGVQLDTTAGRYSVAENGTLLISNVESGDEGTYSARGEAGLHHGESGDINVIVHVIPSINSSIVRESRTIGGNITFPCSASGVPEPTVTWSKGSSAINDGGRFTISNSRLLIEDIKPEDAGDYSCVASNSAGTKQLTSSLVSVYVPPEISPLSNINIERGTTLRVSCNATGTPAPNVEWLKDGIALPSSHQTKSSGESILNIANIKTDQGGVYECTAMNLAVDSKGNAIKRSQSMEVRVVYPPQFDKDDETKNVRLNSSVTLSCRATGVPVPQITLSRDGKNVPATDNTTADESLLTYSIGNVNMEDLGVYTCSASSSLGDAQKSITLSVPLDKPEISNVKTTCSGVSFSWHRDTQGYVKINSYAVTVARSADQVVVKTADYGSNTWNVTFDDGLDESTEYELKVKQMTDVNIGKESTKLATTTKCPLKEINSVATDGNTVKIYWPEVMKKNVSKFIVKYRVKGSSGMWMNKTTEKIYAEVSGLGYGKTYEFQVFYQDAGMVMKYTDIRDVEVPEGTTPKPTKANTAETMSTTGNPSEPGGGGPEPVARSEGLSGGAIAAIVIVIILLVLIAVDIFCCFFNQCGVVHMCAAACSGKGREKYNVDGTTEEGTKLKEVGEEGKQDPEA